MSLQQCTLSWQAFTTCASHAMSTEKQEVMGLLLGRWNDGGGPPSATVDHAMILTRTDKREDRVEVGYKQLAEAADIAERMSVQLGQVTRVVGWYHSHPHITVLPSHVDVRTQGQYQSMDTRFIGLIFSVFNDDKHSKVGTIEVTAFQARNDSEAAGDLGNGGGGRGSLNGAGGGGGGTWERTEVALSLHGPGAGSGTTPLSDALERVVRLQDTLFGEERAGYLAALRQSDGIVGPDGWDEEGGEEYVDAGSPLQGRRRSQGGDVLSKLFCSAVYSKSLAALSGDSAVPLAQTLRSQLNMLQNRVTALHRRGAELRSQLTPAELEEAALDVKANMRKPCSAGLQAFQAKHDGELDIPRADALRFAREGALLRRDGIIQSTPIMVRIFREYPREEEQEAAAAAAAAAAQTRFSSQAWSARRVGSGVETSEVRQHGGGVWIVEMAGKRKRLLGLRPTTAAAVAAPSKAPGGGSGGGGDKQQHHHRRRRRALLVKTAESGEMIFVCEDQEEFRMWLGVAAAVFPFGDGS